MAVKILIYRTISEEQEKAVRPLMKELRKFALKSKGYISGESLISGENLEDQLIISSWESRDDWETFLDAKDPKQIRYQVDQILGRESIYKVYYLR